MIPYKIRKYWDELRWWWNPRQKWLIKKIPNHWVDKDYLWEICILEGIKHYVEQDGGLDFNNYVSNQTDASYPEWQKKFDKEVKFFLPFRITGVCLIRYIIIKIQSAVLFNIMFNTFKDTDFPKIILVNPMIRNFLYEPFLYLGFHHHLSSSQYFLIL